MSLTKATFSMIEGTPVSIIDYGADPTGVADSTSAIQNALDTGKPVYVSEGDFSISSTINIPANSSITGVGKITGAGTLKIAAPNVSLNDFVCDVQIELTSDSGSINLNCSIDGVEFGNSGQIVVGSFLNSNQIRDFSITNCVANGTSGSPTFITINNGWNFVIANNQSISRSFGLVKGFCGAANGVISNNFVDGGVTGIAWLSEGASARRFRNSVTGMQITNNVFQNITEEAIAFDCNAQTASNNTVNKSVGLCKVVSNVGSNYTVEYVHGGAISNITTQGGEYVVVLTGAMAGAVFTAQNVTTPSATLNLITDIATIPSGSILAVGSIFANNIISGNSNLSNTGSLLLYGHCFNNIVENNSFPNAIIGDVGVTNSTSLDNANVNGFNVLRNNRADTILVGSTTFSPNGTPVSGNMLKPYGEYGIENVGAIAEDNICNTFKVSPLRISATAGDTASIWYDTAVSEFKEYDSGTSTWVAASSVSFKPKNVYLKGNQAKKFPFILSSFYDAASTLDYSSTVVSKDGRRVNNDSIEFGQLTQQFFLEAAETHTFDFAVEGTFASGVIKVFGYVSSGGPRLQYISSFGYVIGDAAQFREVNIVNDCTDPAGSPAATLTVTVSSPSTNVVRVAVANTSGGDGFFYIIVDKSFNTWTTPAYISIPSIID